MANLDPMGDIDWTDIGSLEADRPALILELMTAGDADGFSRALEAGLDASAGAEIGGSWRTPAHHAAAADDVAALELLVAHGADLTVRDPQFNATPLGWATFFEKKRSAAYLRGLGAPE